jgi:hypothetical protein
MYEYYQIYVFKTLLYYELWPVCTLKWTIKNSIPSIDYHIFVPVSITNHMYYYE